MIPRSHLLVAAVATVAAAAPATATAAAPSMFPKRTFAVSVEGVQTTNSSYTHPSSGRCDPAATSRGYEQVVFHSSRPKVIDATDFAPLVLFGHGRPGDHTLNTAARVTRRSSYTHGTVDPTCLGTGGGGTAPSPDCGSRRVNLRVDFDWYNPKGIVLRTPDLGIPRSPFNNCPVSGVLFPQVLDAATGGRTIIARIPASDLFNHAWRKHILIGRGRFVSHAGDGGYTTSIRWTVTLTAVGPRH
jgi:hypothetical protein